MASGIGLVEDGDIIEIDIPGRSLHVEVTEEEFDRRWKNIRPGQEAQETCSGQICGADKFG